MEREMAIPFEAASVTYDRANEVPFRMDEESFRDLYARTARPLRAYLSRVSGDPALADDFLQETYLRLLRAELPELDESGQKNYLYRIATNLVNDHFRTSKRAQRTAMPEIATGERTGEEIQLRADLSRVFAELKPQERQILWLAYVEGTTHKEISQALGLKAASIRVLLFRARQKLAGMLRQKGLDQVIPSG
jgi:RNA polymerase sigma-70 factor (ECF subfamily)